VSEVDMKKRLKINGIIMFVATVILAAFPGFFYRRFTPGFMDSALEIFGLAFILLGQLFRVSSRGFKSENSKNGFGLVENGPYSLVRNPMYLGIILIGFGVVLILFQLWVVVIFLCFFAARYIILIYKEEKKLALLFHEQYTAYCQKVPQRVFPSINAFFNRDIHEYMLLKFTWIKKEAGSIITVLALVALVESFEDLRNGGLRVYLSELAYLAIVFLLFLFLMVHLINITNKFNGADKSKDNS